MRAPVHALTGLAAAMAILLGMSIAQAGDPPAPDWPPVYASELERLARGCETGDFRPCEIFVSSVVAGAAAGASLDERPAPFCLAGDIDSRTVLRGFALDLERNPELRSISAAGALILHLKTAHPCKRPPGQQ